MYELSSNKENKANDKTQSQSTFFIFGLVFIICIAISYGVMRNFLRTSYENTGISFS
jgi:hypothetical protein